MENSMLVKLNQVRKQYQDFELNCSLEIEEGKVTGFIGENGAGKSTTFKAILGLIHTEGEVLVFDKPIDKLTKKEKEDIGVVLSDAGFSGYLRVKDIIPVLDQLYENFHREEFIKKCAEFKLPLDKKMKEFSTGMKAKLKILIALSHNARLLILDEPTSGLDVVVREQVLDMLREYMVTEHRSIIISSHISSDLEGICDDIYMIHNGKVILHEDTNVLLDEYGILKVTDEKYQKLDQTYILKSKKEEYGYKCLTNEKQYYLENEKEIVIEKTKIDEIICFMVQN